MNETTYIDVLTSFQSMPMSKYALAEGLTYQWFNEALGVYELEISPLLFDETLRTFDTKLTRYQIRTLALIMYTCYLTRELSRAEKISAINTKDVQMTGGDETKRITFKDLELEINRVDDLLYKQKQHCFS